MKKCKCNIPRRTWNYLQDKKEWKCSGNQLRYSNCIPIDNDYNLIKTSIFAVLREIK